MKQFTKFSVIRHFLKGCLHFFLLCIFCSFAVTVLEMIAPQIIRYTVDAVIGDNLNDLPSYVKSAFVTLGGRDFFLPRLWLIALIICVLSLIASVCRYLLNFLNAKGAEKLQQNMREELFDHIQHLPFAWHMKNQTGDIIQRCTSDVEHVRTFISEQLLSIIRIVAMMALGLAFMFSMDWRLTLVAVITIPIIFCYSLYFRSKIAKHFKECDETEGVLSTIAQENLTGVRVVRAFGREKYEIDRFGKVNQQYADQWVWLMKYLSLFWASGDLISGLQVMLILVLGTVACVRGTLSPGSFIAFFSYNTMIIWPVRYLGRVVSEMSKAGVSIDRVLHIMNAEKDADKPDAQTPDMTGDIEFSHVSFAYDDVPILQNVSFTVKSGTTVGILGGTGSGKSTLMHLLNRLYPLKEGRISVSGVDVADIQASWLRKNIGMVLQEPFLFSRTIGENIAITDDQMPKEEIERAADIACVDEAIKEFSAGYDTVVGERGVTLSGGQKQRTAMARMLTQHAPIMVFDDSLSAVDAEMDALIRKKLKSRLNDATVFLVSHRITTLMQAEQIIVLDHGRIIEQGTHQELLKLNGIYKKIYDLQMTMPEEVETV